MNNIKSILFKRFTLVSWLFLSMSLSLILLMLRIKLHQSFFYLFLIWNLFLALLPYTISMYLSSHKSLTKVVLFFWCLVWLLLLPNAPYIITDLLHLKHRSINFIWLDVLVVLSFALNGLSLFYLSLLDMEILLRRYFNKRRAFRIIVLITCLTSFGVYIGRFLRYNSWDIVQNPQNLITDIYTIIIDPHQHFEAWAFTLLFSLFLLLNYHIIKVLGRPKKEALEH